MKKLYILFVIFALLLYMGCGKAPALVLGLEFDKDGNYAGFKNLPKDYTVEEAKKDGYYVRVDSKTIAGEEIWNDFIKASSNGKNSGIRIVNFWEDKAYFLDLFYTDGSFRVFDSSSEDLKNHKFKYLVNLEGRLPNAAKGGSVVVLTDDKKLTYENVMWSLLSSDSNYSKTIPKYRFIMFQ